MRFRDKNGPLHHPILKPANLPDFLTVARSAEQAKHWRKEFAQMKKHLSDLGTADFALYKSMHDWHNHVGDTLAYMNDILHLHGFDDIVKDDFASLRQMLSERC